MLKEFEAQANRANDTTAAASLPMMDDRLARVRSLLSTRQYRLFDEKPIDERDLFALTEVARWSGSSRNSQPWRFLVVRDVGLIRQTGDLGHPQTRSLHTAMAAIAIAMPDEESRAVGYAYDEGRAAERMLIGASMLGIGAGIAWIFAALRPAVGQLLGVPAGHFVRTIIAVGHPSEEGRARRAAPGMARLPREQVVFEDHWQ
jgi:nitroreductase